MIFDWVMNMVQLDNPLREIAALFWHHHIPCGQGQSYNDHSKLALEIYREYGLQDLSISFTDQGVQTSLSFADRPAQQPQMEGILNKIGPRTM